MLINRNVFYIRYGSHAYYSSQLTQLAAIHVWPVILWISILLLFSISDQPAFYGVISFNSVNHCLSHRSKRRRALTQSVARQKSRNSWLRNGTSGQEIKQRLSRSRDNWRRHTARNSTEIRCTCKWIIREITSDYHLTQCWVVCLFHLSWLPQFTIHHSLLLLSRLVRLNGPIGSSLVCLYTRWLSSRYPFHPRHLNLVQTLHHHLLDDTWTTARWTEEEITRNDYQQVLTTLEPVHLQQVWERATK